MSSSGLVPLADILHALGTELRAMGDTTEQWQTTLGPALLAIADDPLCRREAQAFDRMTQRLHGVASFFAALLPTIPHSWEVDPATAAGSVLLADLALHLCCADPAALDHAAGELEMF